MVSHGFGMVFGWFPYRLEAFKAVVGSTARPPGGDPCRNCSGGVLLPRRSEKVVFLRARWAAWQVPLTKKVPCVAPLSGHESGPRPGAGHPEDGEVREAPPA